MTEPFISRIVLMRRGRCNETADYLRELFCAYADICSKRKRNEGRIIMQVAKAIRSKPVRRDIAAVLADRDLVKIGRRVRRLRGDVADQVRAL